MIAIQDLKSIAMQTKIKLSRNLAGHPYPSRISTEQGTLLAKKIIDTMHQMENFKVYAMNNLPKIDAMVMHEKGLVSKKCLENNLISACMVSADETVVVTANESDHIVMETKYPGFAIPQAYKKINDIDEGVCSKFDIAFDESLGFLSSKIEDIGTGMQVTVQMFLPALCLTNMLTKELENVAHIARASGAFEGAFEAQGYLFEISNTRKLGKCEREILDDMTGVVMAIGSAEKRAREIILETNFDDCMDLVMRSWGILTNAHKISLAESLKYLGDLKLGVLLGIISFKDNTILDKLIQASMPFSIQKSVNTEMGELERDKMRARTLSVTLKKLRTK